MGRLLLFCGALLGFALGASLKDVPSQLISSGTPAKRGEFPFYAYLEIAVNGTSGETRKCGASILSDRFLLTIFSCGLNATIGPDSASTAYVNVVDKRKLQDPRVQSFKFKKVTLRTAFSHDAVYCAVIELDKPIRFNRDVQPIVIARDVEKYTQEGQFGTLVGMGGTFALLQYARLQITNPDKCQMAYGYDYPLGKDSFCAGYGRSGAQEGDQGSPFIVSLGREQVQIGFVDQFLEKNNRSENPGTFVKTSGCDKLHELTRNTFKCI
ncbi:hypothetical protein L596_026559 [Steinernema carpocapsae]|uniref:Peptidase S1 domain-containing protein n=1 Tax=Steinernema carpocapsae TaxID=34508 RepID=A0A4U5M1S9_STECR|nr:hypothetical protein L596_026559 [Steinernema carpocapsae]